MVKRIVAIIMIFAATSVAWLALGGLTRERTNSSDLELRGKVSELWGAEMQQLAPRIYYEKVEPAAQKGNSPTVTRIDVLPEATDLQVDLKLDQRKKGLLWYSTYGIIFDGTYTVKNNSSKLLNYRVAFDFPSPSAIYDNFHFTVDGREVGQTDPNGGNVNAVVPVGPGQVKKFRIAYASRGMDRWFYSFGDKVSQVKNFRLVMTTDFDQIDFPAQTISPANKEQSGDGWKLTWQSQNLISGFRIGMEMPKKINPGPLASQISYFAPVSLLFFFFIIFVLSLIKKINLHPMNYFFLAGAFFSFHLLFSYLVDHIDINLAFVISSLTSVALVVSYLRLVVGTRFAFVEAGLAQLIYLVLFSYAHFFKGFTGLTVTVGSIVTLAVLMQITGRINWEEHFKI
ncbi:MAG: inner membrane CreD family protein [Bacillota bacterium]